MSDIDLAPNRAPRPALKTNASQVTEAGSREEAASGSGQRLADAGRQVLVGRGELFGVDLPPGPEGGERV